MKKAELAQPKTEMVQTKPKKAPTKSEKTATKKTASSKSKKTTTSQKSSTTKTQKTPAKKKKAPAKTKKAEPKPQLSAEDIEFNRLWDLYSYIPENTRELYRGVIREAARLKILCDELWDDINKNGKFEEWVKAGEAYQRERDASKSYRDANRLYQSIIKDLESKLPAKTEKPKAFSKLDDD